MSTVDEKFFGVQRLYGVEGYYKIRSSHVLVVGVGGVGSWVVESLVRSGVGEITLVDHDDVCISNVNRQIQATQETIGKLKVEALKVRAQQINPKICCHVIAEPFDRQTQDKILNQKYDYVVDAIDSVKDKCLLLARCRELKLPVVSVGGAGGKKDPTCLRVADLSQTREDALLRQVRRQLRQEYGFPKNEKKFKIPCVYSEERPLFFKSDGCVTSERPADFLKPLDCQTGFGTSIAVTGTFGFIAASCVLNGLATSSSVDLQASNRDAT